MLALHFQPSLCYKLKGLETHSGKKSQTNHSALFHLFHPVPSSGERSGHNSITDVISRRVSKDVSFSLFLFVSALHLSVIQFLARAVMSYSFSWWSLRVCSAHWPFKANVYTVSDEELIHTLYRQYIRGRLRCQRYSAGRNTQIFYWGKSSNKTLYMYSLTSKSHVFKVLVSEYRVYRDYVLYC